MFCITAPTIDICGIEQIEVGIAKYSQLSKCILFGNFSYITSREPNYCTYGSIAKRIYIPYCY